MYTETYCLMKNLFIYLLILLSWFVCFGGGFFVVCLKHVPRLLSNPMLLHADRALLPSRAPTCISSSNLCRNFTLVLGFWAQHCFRRGGPWDSEELWLFVFFPWWLRIGHSGCSGAATDRTSLWLQELFLAKPLPLAPVYSSHPGP